MMASSFFFLLIKMVKINHTKNYFDRIFLLPRASGDENFIKLREIDRQIDK